MRSASLFLLLTFPLMLGQTESLTPQRSAPQPIGKKSQIEFGAPTARPPITVYSRQSPHGSVANVTAEAEIYLAPDREPLPYSLFLNLSADDGALFPGAMMADNMGLGAGFDPGVDTITSYSLLVYRSPSDPFPGPVDFHVELWDGDPFCAFDTPGAGYACGPIPGTGADFIDIPFGQQIWATHVLPKGVTVPNQRVWMVVSGSETMNPSPCRLGWDIAYGPATIGDNNISFDPVADDLFLTQGDDNNGADGSDYGNGPEGECCADGSACSAAALCASDPAGTRGHCSDGFAESTHLFGTPTVGLPRCGQYAGSQCANFTAAIRAPATTIISLLPVSATAGTINGHELSLPGGQQSFELEVRIGDWDPNDEGTKLKAWEADIDTGGFTSGFKGYLTSTLVSCTNDADCVEAFGGICSITGGECITNSDCPLEPIENCGGSKCGFPLTGPDAGTLCNHLHL